MLQAKAGYIDARPHIRQLDESSLATHGRTIHLGQQQTKRHQAAPSALPPKADIDRRDGNVRFVPIATERNAAKNRYSVTSSARASSVGGTSRGIRGTN